MPKYKVEVDEHTVRHTVYLVEASSAESARDLVEQGKGALVADESTQSSEGEFDVRHATNLTTGKVTAF